MRLIDFYLLLIRLFLGYIFASAGLCKLTGGHFGQLIGPPWLIEALAKYDLAMFGYFIAFAQVVVGLLVLSQYYAVLGLIMLVPMNLSILMVTIAQHWQGTPYVDAVFVLLNVLALLYEWNSLKFLLLPTQTTEQVTPRVNVLFPQARWAWIGLICGAAAAIVGPWFNGATLILGALAFICFYCNVFQYPDFNGLEKAILVLSGLAILNVTFAQQIGFQYMWLGLAGMIVLIVVLLLIRSFLFKK